jgi:DNA-binding CsgD family transcriptional regulator
MIFGEREWAGAILSFDVPEAARLRELPPATREVAVLLVQGLSLSEIGNRRGRSRFTVLNQVQALYRRFGVGSRPDFVRVVTRWSQPGRQG